MQWLRPDLRKKKKSNPRFGFFQRKKVIFTRIEPNDQVVLEKWIDEQRHAEKTDAVTRRIFKERLGAGLVHWSKRT